MSLNVIDSNGDDDDSRDGDDDERLDDSNGSCVNSMGGVDGVDSGDEMSRGHLIRILMLRHDMDWLQHDADDDLSEQLVQFDGLRHQQQRLSCI